MAEFHFQSLFPLGADTTEYRLLSRDGVVADRCGGEDILRVAPGALTLLAEQALADVSFLLRPSHLAQLRAVLEDRESSDNDRFVATELLANAAIAAERVYPLCQDTGTAILIGRKGHRVWTDGRDVEALSLGVFNAYTRHNLRYSQNAALTMDREVNTGTNLPAEVDIEAVEGEAYDFLVLAKGGGSSNKTALFQQTKAVLDPKVLLPFLTKQVEAIGTAACPPYHLAVVVGGLTPELVLKTVKLASARDLDALPTHGGPEGFAFRDLELERELLEATRRFGIGAGFGGKYFCLDVRVIRLPRHGASCPIGIGVSCNADRNIKARISREGLFLERLETHPEKYLVPGEATQASAVALDLNRPLNSVRAELGRHPVGTRFALSGPIVVARDIAHARIKERLDRGEDLPGYFKDHVIYYAGPAKTPAGRASGSLGPTTAGRMDDYVPLFQSRGGSLVMLAKGNRSKAVTDSCRRYGGFYLGSIGGPAARLGRDRILSQELIDFPDLGMEAVYRITVKDFPAFLILDDKGHDFYERFRA